MSTEFSLISNTVIIGNEFPLEKKNTTNLWPELDILKAGLAIRQKWYSANRLTIRLTIPMSASNSSPI